jgi:hypothetical protein
VIEINIYPPCGGKTIKKPLLYKEKFDKILMEREFWVIYALRVINWRSGIIVNLPLI